MAGKRRKELKLLLWLGKGQPVVLRADIWAGTEGEAFRFRYMEAAELNAHWNRGSGLEK